jgi:RimJ/RimL family protein N-acetyltransferase
MRAPSVGLRPFQEADLALLTRWATEPAFSTPFEWGGFRSPEPLRRRLADDGFLDQDPRFLAVTADGDVAGLVTWRDPDVFGRAGWAWEIGVLLAPEHRGRGAGTEAQRQLVAYLFDTTPVHRLCAHTEADNAAEQRALEACGFRREGLLRAAGFRQGRWRDVVAYGLLRDAGPGGN